MTTQRSSPIDTGEKAALLSDEHPPRYRYWLSRTWEKGDGRMLFIGLNPSVADHIEDDQTIRRCVHFARREGFGGIYMVNLYALRSTKPSALNAVDDPIGPLNDQIIRNLVGKAGAVVCCWGANTGPDPFRAATVRELVAEMGADAQALGFTGSGQPRHPSRLANDVELVPYPLDADSRFANREPAPSTPGTDEHRLDVCGGCGHTRIAHRRAGTCLTYIPSKQIKGIDYRLPPIELATELQFVSKARAHAADWTSSVCACMGFQPSGMRVVIPAGAEERRALRDGRARRSVLPIAELL